MIVYRASKGTFINDCLNNDITRKIREAFRAYLGRDTSANEILSWKNSIRQMGIVLNDHDIPSNSTVAIEFQVPLTSKRIDCIIAGKDTAGKENVVIVELKQWETARMTGLDGIVVTRFQDGEKEVAHPSYQALSYAMTLTNFCETVTTDNISLYPCAYLHNYVSDGVIDNSFYGPYIKEAPLFLSTDGENLRSYIKKYIHKGDDADVLYRIENGRIVPSKHLADAVVSMLDGNQEFKMLDEQKVVFEKAVALCKIAKPDKKQVLIVKGGPGTGKSVVAINLLAEFIKNRYLAKYVTKNTAPREVYSVKLASSGKKKKLIGDLFSGSGCFYEMKKNTFDALIVDEAHRLNLKSGMYQNKGDNQIAEIIDASKFSIFFIDDRQKIHIKDIGSARFIKQIAEEKGARVTMLALASQFRCNGSDGYLSWIDNSLQITETANVKLSADDYDFKIFDDPVKLYDEIRRKNMISNKARMVAGYCWQWNGKKNPSLKDVVIEGTGFAMPWNFATDKTWAISSDSIGQIGCIHTCQGLEMDYVGVIVGPDMRYENGKVITDVTRRASSDKSVNGCKTMLKNNPVEAQKVFDGIIKNTYRTLLTRGMKGCYVYFCDKPLAEHFKRQMNKHDASSFKHQKEIKKILRVELEVNDDAKYVEYLPYYSLRAACGRFGDYENVEVQGWVKVEGLGRLGPAMFVVRAFGNSMLPKIKDGDLCVFRANPTGTRNGKILLVQHNQYDSDYSGAYTIKEYSSIKSYDDDGLWHHEKITLNPLNKAYEPILLSASEAEEFRVIGEFVGVIE